MLASHRHRHHAPPRVGCELNGICDFLRDVLGIVDDRNHEDDQLVHLHDEVLEVGVDLVLLNPIHLVSGQHGQTTFLLASMPRVGKAH